MKSRLETELDCDFETHDSGQRLTVLRTFSEAYQLVADHFLVMTNIIEQSTRNLVQRTQSASNADDVKAMYATCIEIVDESMRDFPESLKASADLLRTVLELSGLQINNKFPTVQ